LVFPSEILVQECDKLLPRDFDIGVHTSSIGYRDDAAGFKDVFFAPPHPHRTEGARSLSMKIRKRDKIIVLFWIPFYSLLVGFCALLGWAVTSIRL
jgi:hypothetical protein